MSHRILLVEDDDDDVFFLRRALDEAGVRAEVDVANDGAAAWNILCRMALPDLVVLDLKLPRLNGLDLLRRIRSCEDLKTLPVVVLTASAEQQDRQEAEGLGVELFLRKPSDADLGEVARMIDGLIAGSRAHASTKSRSRA